jgi:SAM-dependent methyltransferase
MALLEHIQDDQDLLRQMSELLRPGGLFVMEVPSAERRTIAEIEAEDGHQRPGYVYAEVPELLESVGFEVKRSCTMDPLGLMYYWCACGRLIRGGNARGRLFPVLAPFFLTLVRLTSALIERPGTELCFLAIKGLDV